MEVRDFLTIEIVKGGGVDDNPNSNNDYRPDM